MADEIKLSGILEKGYGISPKLTMTDTSLSIEAKAIYAYLSSFCGNGTSAFPSIDIITHHLNISKNRFYKYRKELIDKGYIKVIRRREGKKAISNMYQLNLELPCFEDIHFKDIHFEDIHFEDIQNRDTNNNSINNNSINKKNNNIYSESLIKKIMSYPGKKTKDIRDKKLPQLIKKYGEEQIIRCIERYSEEVKGREKRYILNESTFWNGRYVDYLDINYEHDNVEEDINKPQKTGYKGYEL